MSEEAELYQGKSVGDLGREAVSFLLHTLIALAVVLLVMLAGSLFGANPDAAGPKVIATLFAFVLALALGFVIAKARHDYVARYVWFSGLILFAIVCVWVLDLPTGNGLCEHCGAVDKLTRTFFSVENGSGLAGGWGVVLGCWVPLALFGYALGAHLGLGREREVMLD